MRGSSSYRADVQGLRALAVVAVVLYHAGLPLSGGFVGVDVFFVISGYVIGAALQREWSASGTIDLRRFYLRRARRLLPAFAAMVTTVILVGFALSPASSQPALARTGLAASLFNANTYLATQSEGYFERTIELNALLHTWSLSVEEQFYFVVPFLLLAAWRVGRRVAPAMGDLPVAVVVSALSVGSGVLMVWLTYLSGIGASWAFYLAPARAWEFFAGVLIVLFRPVVVRLPRPLGGPAAALGMVGIGVAAWSFDSATVFPGVATLLPVGATALLLVAGELDPETPLVRALGSRPATWIGDVSYSWYLWHWPAIVFAAAWWPASSIVPSVAALASLGLAWVSYGALEQPIRLTPNPTVRRTTRLAFGCVGVGVVVSGALVAANPSLTNRSEIVAYGPHWADTAGCDDGTPVGELPPTCTTGDGDLDVVIVGDSQAVQLTEGVQLGLGPAATISTAGLNACPFVDLWIERYPGTDHRQQCEHFVAESLRTLVASPPDLVVISSAAPAWVSGDRTMWDPVDGRPLVGLEARASAWERGLERVVEPLVDAQVDVVIVHASPQFDDWWPSACAVLRLAITPDACATSMSRAEGEARRAPAHAVETAVARRHELRTIDPFAVVCGDTCVTREDGWSMRDANHLSIAGSEALAPMFAALLDEPRPSALRIVGEGP